MSLGGDMYGRERSPRACDRVVASARFLVLFVLCGLAALQAVSAAEPVETQAAICSDLANAGEYTYVNQRREQFNIWFSHFTWGKWFGTNGIPTGHSAFDAGAVIDDAPTTKNARCVLVGEEPWIAADNEFKDGDVTWVYRKYYVSGRVDTSPLEVADFDDGPAGNMPPLSDTDLPRDPAGGPEYGRGRGASCNDGASFTHNAALVPAGYVALPFDGYRRADSGWSCAAELLDWYLAQSPNQYVQDSGRVTALWWAYGSNDLQGYDEAGPECTDLSRDCVELQYTAKRRDTGEIFRDKISVYGRCPPSTEFSYSVGACIMPKPVAKGGSSGIDEINIADLPKVDLKLDDVKGCPAPVYVDLEALGTEFKLLDFEPTCDVLQDYVRPILLMLATLTSAFVIMGMGLGGTGD